MADGDDDGRTDARINHGVAVVAVYHAFVLAVYHGAAAMATIDVVAVPVVQGQAGDAGKGQVTRPGSAHEIDGHIGKAVPFRQGFLRQVELGPVFGKEPAELVFSDVGIVGMAGIAEFFIARQPDQDLAALIRQQNTIPRQRHRVVFDMVRVIANVLYHSTSFAPSLLHFRIWPVAAMPWSLKQLIMASMICTS